MKFSQRIGITKVSDVIQVDDMSQDLRSSLWNVLLAQEFNRDGFVWEEMRGGTARIFYFSRALWTDYFKKPVDECPDRGDYKLAAIRQYFFDCIWYEVYEFLEFCIEHIGGRIAEPLNEILERELSGFRVIGGKLAPVSSKEELDTIQEAISDNSFPGACAHLKASLDLLSHKTNPDYRNSIKESISAVESASCAIMGSKSATLGQALKELAKTHTLHDALMKGFDKLYGYTSNGDGIRHAMIEESDLKQEDAIYFLISCSAFINYLRIKTKK
jgi:hypothetical protein